MLDHYLRFLASWPVLLAVAALLLGIILLV
jgi:hypothetical protein